MPPEEGNSAPSGALLSVVPPLKTPSKPKKHICKSADPYAKNFNSTRRSTQKGDYLDGPPPSMPETYTVQSKKRGTEDRTKPIVVPDDFCKKPKAQSGTPTPLERSIGIRRTQSAHRPKPSADPFIARRIHRKRYVSQIVNTDHPKTITGSSRISAFGAARRTLFEEEIAARSHLPRGGLARRTVKEGFEDLLQDNKSIGSSSSQSVDGKRSDDQKVLTSDSEAETIVLGDDSSESDGRQLYRSQKRRKLSGKDSKTAITTTDNLKVVTTKITWEEVEEFEYFKIEESGSKDIDANKTNIPGFSA